MLGTATAARTRPRLRGTGGLVLATLLALAVLPDAARAGTLAGPHSVSFGDVAVNSPSNRLVLITNDGTTTRVSASVASGGDFSEDGGCDAAVLGPGQLCSIAVSFLPRVPGPQAGTLTIESDSAAGPLEIPLGGTGVTPDFEISPAPFSFPPVLTGAESAPQSFTVANVGGAPGTISGVGLSGDPHFRLAADDCGARTVAVGDACSIEVAFAPASEGTWSAELEVASDALDSPDLVALTGATESSPRGKPPVPPGRARCKRPKGAKKPPELPRRCRPHHG